MNLRRINACLICSLLIVSSVHADGPIAIEVPVRTRPVDFDAEIMPILRTNCLACHNAKKDSGGLNLESVEQIVKGASMAPLFSSAGARTACS